MSTKLFLTATEGELLRSLALVTNDTYSHPGADEQLTRAGYRLAAHGLAEHPPHGGAAVRATDAGREVAAELAAARLLK